MRLIVSTYSFSSPLEVNRHPHDARHPFTVISNSVVQGSLSPAARMLLIWLLSQPPGWKTSIEAIRHQFCPGVVLGEHNLRSWVKELEERGHLMRVQEKHGTRFGEVRWYVSETPQKKFPNVENQQTAETPCGSDKCPHTQSGPFVENHQAAQKGCEQEKCPHTQSGPFVDLPRAEDQGLRKKEGQNTEDKTEKERPSVSLPPTVQDFIDCVDGRGLHSSELYSLAKRAVDEGLSLEDFRFCLERGRRDVAAKPELGLGSAVGQVMRLRIYERERNREHVNLVQTHLEANLEALKQAVAAFPAPFRGAERNGNTYRGGFGTLDLTQPPEKFLVSLNVVVTQNKR